MLAMMWWGSVRFASRRVVAPVASKRGRVRPARRDWEGGGGVRLWIRDGALVRGWWLCWEDVETGMLHPTEFER